MCSEKWQDFYTIMESNDFDNFGIDIQEIFNSRIMQNDFARVLKIDCGSGHERYLKNYIYKEWKFQFLSNRMANPIRQEVKITDQLSNETYDFSNPNENRNVVNRWLDYFIECCRNSGIIIEHNNLNNQIFKGVINSLDSNKFNLYRFY